MDYVFNDCTFLRKALFFCGDNVASNKPKACLLVEKAPHVKKYIDVAHELERCLVAALKVPVVQAVHDRLLGVLLPENIENTSIVRSHP